MNPLKGEAVLELEDGLFTLVFDYEAMILAEATYGQPIGVTSIHADQGFVGAIRALLYGTLRAHHSDVTLAEATAMTFADAGAVKAALDAAAHASLPTPEPEADDGDAEDKDGPRPRRAGTSSGRSGAKPGSTPTPGGGRRRGRSGSSSAAG